MEFQKQTLKPTKEQLKEIEEINSLVSHNVNSFIDNLPITPNTKEITKEIKVLSSNINRINAIKNSPYFNTYGEEFKRNVLKMKKEIDTKKHTLLGMDAIVFSKDDYCNLIKEKNELFQHFSILVRNNLEVSETAINSNPSNYQFIPDKFKNNKELVLKHLKMSEFKVFPYISPQFQNDKDINELKNHYEI